MLQIGIADIHKTPSLIDKLDDVATIVNKKTKDVKGFFIPVEYKSMIEDVLEEIEYQRFLKRNQALISKATQEDNTLLDGLDDVY
ncbi:MAG: hypothetical protein U9N49_08060 [Campylobacterota bacterium]|nr:hypothetical protein [Campylobacterota bacterium]